MMNGNLVLFGLLTYLGLIYFRDLGNNAVAKQAGVQQQGPPSASNPDVKKLNLYDELDDEDDSIEESYPTTSSRSKEGASQMDAKPPSKEPLDEEEMIFEVDDGDSEDTPGVPKPPGKRQYQRKPNPASGDRSSYVQPNLVKPQAVPGAFRVLVQFCTSCNYKRNFMELKRFLEHHYPSLAGQVNGENFPPPLHAQIIAKIASLSMMAGVVLVFFGEQALRSLGIQPPASLFDFIKQNKMGCMAALFMLNTVAQSMTATGAFEVFLNGRKVFSKIDSGRMPTIDELRSRFATAGLETQDGIHPI